MRCCVWMGEVPTVESVVALAVLVVAAAAAPAAALPGLRPPLLDASLRDATTPRLLGRPSPPRTGVDCDAAIAGAVVGREGLPDEAAAAMVAMAALCCTVGSAAVEADLEAAAGRWPPRECSRRDAGRSATTPRLLVRPTARPPWLEGCEADLACFGCAWGRLSVTLCACACDCAGKAKRTPPCTPLEAALALAVRVCAGGVGGGELCSTGVGVDTAGLGIELGSPTPRMGLVAIRRGSDGLAVVDWRLVPMPKAPSSRFKPSANSSSVMPSVRVRESAYKGRTHTHTLCAARTVILCPQPWWQQPGVRR